MGVVGRRDQIRDAFRTDDQAFVAEEMSRRARNFESVFVNNMTPDPGIFGTVRCHLIRPVMAILRVHCR